MERKENYDEFSTKFARSAEDNGLHTTYMLPLPIKFDVYYHLADDVWADYSNGSRLICGVKLPDRLNSCDKMSEPIIIAAYEPVTIDKYVMPSPVDNEHILPTNSWLQTQRRSGMREIFIMANIQNLSQATQTF